MDTDKGSTCLVFWRHLKEYIIYYTPFILYHNLFGQGTDFLRNTKNLSVTMR
jgi:hypothetical protein